MGSDGQDRPQLELVSDQGSKRGWLRAWSSTFCSQDSSNFLNSYWEYFLVFSPTHCLSNTHPLGPWPELAQLRGHQIPILEFFSSCQSVRETKIFFPPPFSQKKVLSYRRLLGASVGGLITQKSARGVDEGVNASLWSKERSKGLRGFSVLSASGMRGK